MVDPYLLGRQAQEVANPLEVIRVEALPARFAWPRLGLRGMTSEGTTGQGDLPTVEVVLQPMVHVRDLAATVASLRVLGGTVAQGSQDGDWVQVAIGGAELGVLAHPPNPDQGEGDVVLNFEARTPLEDIESAAREAGITINSPTTDTGFGRQLQLRTPDGFLVKINRITPDRL
ncbi:VOC family protein [Phycicoccus sp. M110.8]|uniref:VOC family protein n=1 Tax=Phycicoccus sp. M110.8 TaxID=3075433 RepID=UPI0028FDB802|nr:VOC family protein [Phycicoccus sp. M110.8]MDU0314097.1 VOC family protein [Phycicoccus sp. M110.8]